MTVSGRRRALLVLVEVAVPAVVLAVLFAWSEEAGSFYFPPASQVAESFADTWLASGFTQDVLPSLGRLVAGYAIAVVAGIGLGVLIAERRWLRAATAPIVEFLRALPASALIPTFILALGVGETSKIAMIAFGCLWPVLLSTVDGIRTGDSTYLTTARAYRIGSARRLWRVTLPAAAPQIAAGMRTSVSLALILMVVSEMVASTGGIGHFVLQAQSQFDMAAMWAGIVLIGLLGYLLNAVFSLAERRVLAWHYEEREAS